MGADEGIVGTVDGSVLGEVLPSVDMVSGCVSGVEPHKLMLTISSAASTTVRTHTRIRNVLLMDEAA